MHTHTFSRIQTDDEIQRHIDDIDAILNGDKVIERKWRNSTASSTRFSTSSASSRSSINGSVAKKLPVSSSPRDVPAQPSSQDASINQISGQKGSLSRPNEWSKTASVSPNVSCDASPTDMSQNVAYSKSESLNRSCSQGALRSVSNSSEWSVHACVASKVNDNDNNNNNNNNNNNKLQQHNINVTQSTDHKDTSANEELCGSLELSKATAQNSHGDASWSVHIHAEPLMESRVLNSVGGSRIRDRCLYYCIIRI